MSEKHPLIRPTAYLLAARRGLLGPEAPETGEDLREFVRRGILDLETFKLLEREAEILVTGRYPEYGDQPTAVAGALEPAAVPPGGLFPWQDWSRYRPEAYLGEGGMGWVFRARDLHLQRTVALKFFRSGLPEASQVFLREARSQARIDHPHVARVYEAGEQEGVPFLSMQYIHGPTLQKGGSGLDLRDRVEVIRQAALGVHAAHRLGIVHRDLKPGNIMLEWDAQGAVQAFVMDFGLARDLSDTPTGLTRIMGTPAYMSPEQVEGPSVLIGPHTDVFALGVTLYELMAGRLPFESPSHAEMMRRIVHEDPVPLRKVDPALPREIEAVVQRCMEKDVLRRYDSAQDLADELQRFLEGRPVLAAPLTGWHLLARKVKRNPLPYASAGAAVLLAAGWSAYALATRSREMDLGRRIQATEAELSRAQGEMDRLKVAQAEERRVSEELARKIAAAPTEAERRAAEAELKASQERERGLALLVEAAQRRSQELARSRGEEPPRPATDPPTVPPSEARESGAEGGPRRAAPPVTEARPAAPPADAPVVSPPVMLVQGDVRYPRRALSSPQNPYRSQAVAVLLRITVDAAGQPEGATILEGVQGPWGFNEAALDVVRRSTYAPAQRDGKPTAGTLDIRVVFKRPGT